MVPLDKI
jgi:hypothetical protein